MFHKSDTSAKTSNFFFRDEFLLAVSNGIAPLQNYRVNKNFFLFKMTAVDTAYNTNILRYVSVEI